jgi:hypothetical protein
MATHPVRHTVNLSVEDDGSSRGGVPVLRFRYSSPGLNDAQRDKFAQQNRINLNDVISASIHILGEPAFERL